MQKPRICGPQRFRQRFDPHREALAAALLEHALRIFRGNARDRRPVAAFDEQRD
jgi:hypothetical protein